MPKTQFGMQYDEIFKGRFECDRCHFVENLTVASFSFPTQNHHHQRQKDSQSTHSFGLCDFVTKLISQILGIAVSHAGRRSLCSHDPLSTQKRALSIRLISLCSPSVQLGKEIPMHFLESMHDHGEEIDAPDW
jgi:hypothetical protein